MGCAFIAYASCPVSSHQVFFTGKKVKVPLFALEPMGLRAWSPK